MPLLALSIVPACPSAADPLRLLRFHGPIIYEPADIFTGDSVCDVRELLRIEPYSAFSNTKHLSSESLLVRQAGHCFSSVVAIIPSPWSAI